MRRWTLVFGCWVAWAGCSETASEPRAKDAVFAGTGGVAGSAPAAGGTAGWPPADGHGDAGASLRMDAQTAPFDAAQDAAPSDARTPSDAAGADAGVDAERCGVAKLNASSPPQALTLSGDLGVHDPALIEADGRYYLFYTGDGIGTKVSDDLQAWDEGPPVFAQNPGWIASAVPGATNLWAPDVAYFGGQYHLYYSASTFGSNHSCIGHATRAALDQGGWSDQGAVVCSNDGGPSDNWNAIDPNVVIDTDGTAWLSFGSFWSGLKLVRLTQSGARADDTLHAIASRPAAGGALEAPFIVYRCGYYYLFASFDSCCQGASSTYKIMVGRSTSVSGPYVDQDGSSMLQGGGSLLVQTAGNWRGPGHNAVIFSGEAAYNVYHAYDASRGGAPRLRIAELAWDADGWPVSGGP